MNGTGIIYSNSDDCGVAAEALFAPTLDSTRDYMRSKVERYSQALTSAGANIHSNIVERFDSIHSSAAVQRINSIRSKIQSMWQTNTVRYLPDIPKVQQAPTVMQRWVMANPRMSQLYSTGAIEGYDGAAPVSPVGIKGSTYDYRRATNGLLQYDPTNHSAQTVEYTENIKDPLNDLLNIVEQASIRATWNVLNTHLDSDSTVDPTSVWNGTIS